MKKGTLKKAGYGLLTGVTAGALLAAGICAFAAEDKPAEEETSKSVVVTKGTEDEDGSFSWEDFEFDDIDLDNLDADDLKDALKQVVSQAADELGEELKDEEFDADELDELEDFAVEIIESIDDEDVNEMVRICQVADDMGLVNIILDSDATDEEIESFLQEHEKELAELGEDVGALIKNIIGEDE